MRMHFCCNWSASGVTLIINKNKHQNRDPVNLLSLYFGYCSPLVQWNCNRCNVTKVLKKKQNKTKKARKNVYSLLTSCAHSYAFLPSRVSGVAAAAHPKKTGQHVLGILNLALCRDNQPKTKTKKDLNHIILKPSVDYTNIHHITYVFKVHWGSTVRLGTCGLPYYCTPLVCILDLSSKRGAKIVILFAYFKTWHRSNPYNLLACFKTRRRFNPCIVLHASRPSLVYFRTQPL